MPFAERDQRLRADADLLAMLAAASPLFEVAAEGDPPSRYTLTFHGRGISRCPESGDDVELSSMHQVEMRLSFAYPRVGPDLRWKTPLFHPNVSFSGFIQLDDLGLQWDESLGLRVVVERLWDTLRWAYVNLDNATNYAAKRWVETACRIALPVDVRPLWSDPLPQPAEPSSEASAMSTAAQFAVREEPAEEILYIDENTPLPEGFRPRQARGRKKGGGIFYIGDE